MCGILGIWRLRGARLEAAHVDKLGTLIAERGPDGAGTWLHPLVNVAFGQRRLAILDLSPTGRQPMTSGSGRLIITFNGEIYNYLELRAELERGGCTFRGSSDTEVLLESIETWGLEEALLRIEGMFAFGLWDEDAQCVTLVRDRFGEKPLYYLADNDGLVFSSSLRVLLGERRHKFTIDSDAAYALLTAGFISHGRTIFRNIKKLAPGTWLTFALRDGQLVRTEGCFWSIRDVAAAGSVKRSITLDEATDHLEDLFESAIVRTCRADVPYGAFLSGGLDSSCVVALMKRVTNRTPLTFNIGFDDPLYDESPAARAVAQALETDHTEIRVSDADIVTAAGKLGDICDEPVVDVSLIPTYLLARETRRHVTVALSGDGGDELFGGYNRYIAYARLQALGGSTALAGIKVLAALAANGAVENVLRALARVTGTQAFHAIGDKLAKLATLDTVSDLNRYYASVIAARLPNEVLGPFFTPAPEAPHFNLAGPYTPLTRLRLADMDGYLPDGVLQKVDRAAMAVSLEVRAPFLSASVATFALGLPDHVLVSGGKGKIILRHLANRLLPSSLARRPKAGFSPPIRRWLGGPLKELVRDSLSSSAVRRSQFFAPEGVARSVARLEAGDSASALFIWRAMCLQLWAEHYAAS